MRTDEKKGKVIDMTLNTEYVRNLNCNYERILLDKKPEEKRYQYCILNRGGIKGLLPCSLRYINGVAYLYYDISSKQNVTQLYGNKCVSRAWVTDFLWSMQRIRQELERFLLDSKNIVWRPEQIFQDLESNVFSFLYVPYYEGDSGYLKLMEFLIDHIDYEDETLVECVYSMYEQLERNGEVYLQAQIYEDAKRLEAPETGEAQGVAAAEREAVAIKTQELEDRIVPAEESGRVRSGRKEAVSEESGRVRSGRKEAVSEESGRVRSGRKEAASEESGWESALGKETAGEEPYKGAKRGFFSIFEGKRKRGREQREDYRQAMRREMEGYAVPDEMKGYAVAEERENYAVAEETRYDDEPYGRTVFMEEKAADTGRPHRLFTPEGRLLATLDKPVFSIGKKREDVDLVLENLSVSRIHARIVQEKTEVYVEDLNSTNGTYKNGLRMQPYEKRKLEEGDEIKCGAVILIFR